MSRGDHRWATWPWSQCIDCGCEDPKESILTFPGYDLLSDLFFDKDEEAKWREQNKVGLAPCAEPGSDRHNPYAKKELKNES